jgi:hypothetical protein
VPDLDAGLRFYRDRLRGEHEVPVAVSQVHHWG